MSVWWVNLGERFAEQNAAEALWCPNRTVRQDGTFAAPQWHWSNIQEVRVGEFIVLARDGSIEGLGIVRQTAIPDSPKPAGFPEGKWHNLGWLLPTTFILFDRSRSRDDLTAGLFLERVKHSPLLNQENGKGRGAQIYLTRIRDIDGVALFDRIAAILDVVRPGWLDRGIESSVEDRSSDPADASAATSRTAIIQARVGQGQFRKSLIALWGGQCCATGLDILDLLVASHIHPWAAASDVEKLDPFNGLLLSPAFNAAFDKGLISLNADGTWMNAASLSPTQLEQAGLANLERFPVTGLNMRHGEYLTMHRHSAQERAKTLSSRSS
ncbi:HNH endonuclease [Mesorhizobium sp.]|uniref:HNH endonuclease n=1 Tax=Mesorhizobium sp. TaxID=1871066 RepID=UPI000FE7843D|nr:HNH endonuclease [Mesorhizobium sp.]RWP37997.1 MAG: HNH endonuclease [Mesorhizobium sp.]